MCILFVASSASYNITTERDTPNAEPSEDGIPRSMPLSICNNSMRGILYLIMIIVNGED